MSKKKNLRICNNYAKPCPLANTCENCKYREMGTRKGIFGLKGCKLGYEIDKPIEGKSKCFFCEKEGIRCKGE